MSESEFKKVLGKNIENLLKENNLTQSELANKIGVSESTVGKWILSKSAPRAGVIDKISELFNIPKSQLVSDPSKTVSQNKKAIETIAAHMDGVTPTDEQLDKITEYIDFVFRDAFKDK